MNIQGKVWGRTSPLFNKNNVEVHIIEIRKGGFCSKHLHKTKFNKFVVCTGKLQVNIWKDYGNGTSMCDETILTGGEECVVPPGHYHQFIALEDTSALEIYWVELNEDDIIRDNMGGLDATQADTSDEIARDRDESFNAGVPLYRPPRACCID